MLGWENGLADGQPLAFLLWLPSYGSRVQGDVAILVFFSGDWGVHCRYGVLTHGHVNLRDPFNRLYFGTGCLCCLCVCVLRPPLFPLLAPTLCKVELRYLLRQCNKHTAGGRIYRLSYRASVGLVLKQLSRDPNPCRPIE